MHSLFRLREVAKVFTAVLLVMVFCSVTNSIINQHFHKLSSGLVVKHAHPFDKTPAGNPFQDHHHSSSEWVIFEQISNILFWICLFFAFIALLFVTAEIKKPRHFVECRIPNFYFLKNYHAPPSDSY